MFKGVLCFVLSFWLSWVTVAAQPTVVRYYVRDERVFSGAGIRTRQEPFLFTFYRYKGRPAMIQFNSGNLEKHYRIGPLTAEGWDTDSCTKFYYYKLSDLPNPEYWVCLGYSEGRLTTITFNLNTALVDFYTYNPEDFLL